MVEPNAIAQARFHPNVRLYVYLQSLGLLIATVIGIVALPVWIFVGWWWAARYYEALACVLAERSLVVRKGIQFRTEKTIPLDQIQDLSVRHGPILNWLGLSKLVVETAGHGGSQGAAASLTGIVDALAFRDRVLQRRDELQRRSSGPERTSAHRSASSELVPLLREIRDALLRIEGSSDRETTSG